jgi:hypothetical protein
VSPDWKELSNQFVDMSFGYMWSSGTPNFVTLAQPSMAEWSAAQIALKIVLD